MDIASLFSPNWEGNLLPCVNDHTIAFWDISKTGPVWTRETAHSDIVDECKWNNFNKYVSGSISEHSILKIHDLRNDKKSPSLTIESTYNTIAFSTHLKPIWFCRADSNIYLYDKRSMQKIMHLIDGHKEVFTNLEHTSEKLAYEFRKWVPIRVLIYTLYYY